MVSIPILVGGGDPYLGSYWSNRREADAVFLRAKGVFDDLGFVLHRKTSIDFYAGLDSQELFDLIYVDGDNGFVQAFWDMCAFYRHVAEDGLFMVDDYSHVQHPDVTFAVNKFIDHTKTNIAKMGYITGHFNQQKFHVPLSQTTFFCSPVSRDIWTEYPLPSLKKYAYGIRQFVYANKSFMRLVVPSKLYLIAKRTLAKRF